MRAHVPALLRRHRDAVVAAGIIACAIAFRFVLIGFGWPQSESDEATVGLEAMHILLRGEHPAYLYGQSYMGLGEAYIAVLAFRIFGISVFTLRLGMMLFYTIFLVGLYWLASRLYSRRVAIVSLVALALGTPFLIRIQLLADGGKVETLACGVLLYVLAAWLVLSRPTEPLPPQRRWQRPLAYAAWGLIAGFGLYTYEIIAPFVLTSGLLLGIMCWRELRGWKWVLPILGLVIGYLPALMFVATMPAGNDPVSVFLGVHHTLTVDSPTGWHLLVKQIVVVLLYVLPSATGLYIVYPVQAMPFFGPPGPATLAAIALGGGWSLGYLALIAVATLHPLRSLRAAWKRHRPDGNALAEFTAPAVTESAAVARDAARLMLALAGWLTIATYTAGMTAAGNPYSGRYLVGLLIVLPAVLWPLVEGARRAWAKRESRDAVWRLAALLLCGASLVAGSVATLQQLPETVALNQQDAMFANDLLSRGITRFYSDYWTCDLLVFETRERLICGVVDWNAQPGFNRFPPYYAEVQANPHASYLFVAGSPLDQNFQTYMVQTHQQFEVQRLDGYNIYTPMPSSP